MTVKLTATKAPVRREVEIDGEPYIVVIRHDKMTVRRKGNRRELSWLTWGSLQRMLEPNATTRAQAFKMPAPEAWAPKVGDSVWLPKTIQATHGTVTKLFNGWIEPVVRVSYKTSRGNARTIEQTVSQVRPRTQGKSIHNEQGTTSDGNNGKRKEDTATG